MSATAPASPVVSSRLPAIVDIAVYHGDTNAQTFRLLQGDTPLDLTGATGSSTVVDAKGETVVELDVTIGPDPGEITISRPPGPILPAGRFRYDLEVTDANGTITTWVIGRLDVIDITHG